MKHRLTKIYRCLVLVFCFSTPSFGWWSEHVSPFEEYPIAGMRKSDPYVLGYKARRSARKSDTYMKWSFFSGMAAGVTGVLHAVSRFTPTPTNVRLPKGLGLFTSTLFLGGSLHNLRANYFREQCNERRKQFWDYLKGNMPPRGV